MSFRIRLCLAIAVLLNGTAMSKPGLAQTSLTSQQIQDLIRRLDADSFNVREAATTRLVEVGSEAIPLLSEAVSHANLEVSTRLVRILGDLALSDHPATEQSARAALEKIALTRVTSAAARAAETLVTLGEIREERCLEQLKRLGALIERQTYAFTNGSVDLYYSLSFDKRWKGTEEDAELLRGIPHTRHLTLDYPDVNDAWMKHIAHLKGLTDLVVARGQVTGEGLEPLAKLEGLETLQLMYMPIDDSAIETLASLKRLNYMKLYGTKLSKEGVARLRGLLTNCVLDVRRGGFLGIEAAASLPQCTVGGVRSGTAAERAGLAAHDVILQYNGKDVTDFASLTELISDNAPGDAVVLTVQRADQRLEIPVTLGDWPTSVE
jgi:hypothetical protein